MKVQKKLIIAVSGIVFLILLLLFYLSKASRKISPVSFVPSITSFPSFAEKPTFTPYPSVSKPLKDEEKITVSEVEMDNFYKKAQRINSSGDVLVANNDKFQIVYLPDFEKFLISVLSSPFLSIREEAEEEFVKILNIDKKEACRLKVYVTTPFFANPDFAGREFPLSFCR